MSGLVLGLVAHLEIVVGRQPCLFPNLERSTIGEVGSCEIERTNSGVVPLRWEIKCHNWIQQCPKPMSESLLNGQEVGPIRRVPVINGAGCLRREERRLGPVGIPWLVSE